jgi:hypothetical protein
MIRTIMMHPRTRQAGALGALAAALLLCPAAQADTKVGVTAAVNPQATGKPPSSNERVLYVGVDMQADERVRTSADGRVQLLFLDGSALSIGPNSDVVIDKYIYNPDNPDDPGELAFRATRGVFRLVGGKLSKLKPVVLRTPTATLGVRGSGALVDVTNGTSVFTNGDFMTVEAGGKTVKVIRPGSAVDFGSGVPSDPYLVNSNLIKAIQGAFEKSGGLGEISPAAGPGTQGGGTPDNKLAGTNIANTNSSATANALGLPPTDPGSLNKANDVAQDAVANSSNDASSNSTGTGQSNATPPGPPPPPPPPVIFSYEPAFGHLGRTSVSSSVTPGTSTSFPVFTPNTANYNNISQAQVLANNTIVITMPNNETFTFPYTSGLINPSNSVVTMNGLNGTGFVVPDVFFNYLGNFAGGGSFSIYGGVPTTFFPMSGFAAYDSLGSRLPYLGGSTIATIVPFLKGDPGVYVSPMFSAFAANIPVSGQAAVSDARPVTLQASLVIQGSGANQTSLLMGSTGIFSVLANENDVSLTGTAFGTYRPTAASFTTKLFSGAMSQLLTNESGTVNAIFGDNADYIVVGPDSATADLNAAPTTVTRNPNTLGVAVPLSPLSTTGYYFQTTFVNNVTPPPGDLGSARTSRLDSNATPNPLSGYTAGIAEVLVIDSATGTPIGTIVPNPTTVAFQSLTNPTGTLAGDGVHIQTDPTTNRLAATFNIQAQNGQVNEAIALNFGSLTGFSSASSAFIDDTRFGATESPPGNPSTVNGTPVTRSQLFMVSSGTLGSVTIDGVQLCACEFLKWGYWSGEIAYPDTTAGQTVLSRAHLATWVAGDLPSLVEIPNVGTATYNGSIVGNVVNGANQYIAAGAFSHNWSFATRTGALAITNFDTRNFTGSASSANGRDFTGTINATAGISGQYNGSFFKGGADPVAAMGGQFTMSGSNYVAAGTFAAQK